MFIHNNFTFSPLTSQYNGYFSSSFVLNFLFFTNFETYNSPKRWFHLQQLRKCQLVELVIALSLTFLYLPWSGREILWYNNWFASSSGFRFGQDGKLLLKLSNELIEFFYLTDQRAFLAWKYIYGKNITKTITLYVLPLPKFGPQVLCLHAQLHGILMSNQFFLMN